jgi:solute carrier family 13 (sodium-dependent dicarboxylate transporter), member 2/3/5
MPGMTAEDASTATRPVELPGRGTVRRLALAGGPLLALATYALLPDAYLSQTGELVPFTHAGRVSAALAVWMALWWLTEAIELPATALLPLVVLPVTGATSMAAAAAPYATDLIFLFMSGFLISLSMQRWELHRRLALRTLWLVGTRPRRLVGGFMVATAGLSMWLSNTATTVMMLPIAQSVIAMRGRTAGDGALPATFAPALMLGIAYAASIGGVATIVGSTPNLILVAYARDGLGVEISFAKWMSIGLPLALLLLPVTWLLLTRVLFPLDNSGGGERVTPERGPLLPGARVTLAVFLVVVALWLSRSWLVELTVWDVRPFAGLTDVGIGMAGALALFVIPLDLRRGLFVMDWAHAQRLPWGILLLFGGGLSLAAAIDANGVGAFLGAQVGAWRGVSPIVLVLLVSAMVLFLTELTSNTATATTLVPILAGVAPGLGVHPFVLVVPAAIAASWAFMLPAATPPNAIVFGTGYVTMAQMRGAGLWLNLIGIALLTVFVYWVALALLGVDPRIAVSP